MRLLDTTNTMCTNSPCHQLFSVSEQRLDSQDIFLSSRQGQTVCMLRLLVLTCTTQPCLGYPRTDLVKLRGSYMLEEA